MSHSPLRRIVACVGGLLIAVAFAGGCIAEEKASTAAADTIAVDPFVTITVSQDGKTMQAVPYVALRRAGTNLKWNIVSPTTTTGYTIVIDFALTNGRKGPFPKKPQAVDNPVRGSYTKRVTGSDTIDSAPSDQAKDTSWKYSVILRNPSNEDVATLDPIVIFK